MRDIERIDRAPTAARFDNRLTPRYNNQSTVKPKDFRHETAPNLLLCLRLRTRSRQFGGTTIEALQKRR